MIMFLASNVFLENANINILWKWGQANVLPLRKNYFSWNVNLDNL